jgi:hypothetical protein
MWRYVTLYMPSPRGLVAFQVVVEPLELRLEHVGVVVVASIPAV